MNKMIVTGNTENGRLDKFLLKTLCNSPSSLIHKLLRKKIIKLNGKKAGGNEILKAGDVIDIYLSDDTFGNLMGTRSINTNADVPEIIYEDNNILVCLKPAGVLSHPEKFSDNNTMIDRILSYLEKNGCYDSSVPQAFTPALANRLDRNTGGLVLCGKTLPAAQALSEMIREREISKYYYAVCEGVITEKKTISAPLRKDTKTNTVTAVPDNTDSQKAITIIEPIESRNGNTLLDIKLITGRTHQIRAHLSHIGHPIAGDVKYGGKKLSAGGERELCYLLFAYKLVFSANRPPLTYLGGMEFIAQPPDWVRRYNFEI